MEDYYSILGLTRTATADEIKQSYRRLASRHHPDKGGDTATFQKIEEAYRILGDERSRNEYDSRSQRTTTHSYDFSNPFEHFHVNINGGGLDITEILSQFLRGQRPEFRTQKRNGDLRVNIDLSLTETLSVQQKVIHYTNGKNQTSAIEIQIPAGLEDGATIRYPEIGDNYFEALPRGDLYVNIRHVSDSGFNKIGRADVGIEYEIDCWDAMLGTTATVQALDGTVLSVRIPAGSQHGTKLCLKGQGLYHDQSLTSRGNLYVMLRVRIPALGEHARSRIEELKKLV